MGWGGGGRDVHKGGEEGAGMCTRGRGGAWMCTKGEEGAGGEKKQDKRTLLVYSR